MEPEAGNESFEKKIKEMARVARFRASGLSSLVAQRLRNGDVPYIVLGIIRKFLERVSADELQCLAQVWRQPRILPCDILILNHWNPFTARQCN